jgi:hypothetical protein
MERRRLQQIPTRPSTVIEIMRSREFRRGVEEARAGRPPHYDAMDDWEYERGRQWAVVAPRTMPVMIGRKVNPKAIDVYIAATIP